MKCYLCKLYFSPFRVLFSHFRNFHGLASRGSEVKCTFEKCNRVFISFTTLKKHYKTQHSTIVPDEIKASSSTTTNITDEKITIESQTNHTDDIIEVVENPTCINLEISIMKFFSELSAKANITLSNSQIIMENMIGVINDISLFGSQLLKDLIIPLNLAQDNTIINEALMKMLNISNITNNIDTIYKREKWLVDNGFFIKPIEIPLGVRLEQRFSAGLKSMHSVTVEDKCYFVPIDQILAKIMESVSEKIIFPVCSPSSIPTRVRDFFDTRRFHNHPFLQKFPKTFLLHFFIDAFEVTNVLGSHTIVHKLEALYMQVRNVLPEYQSKTDSIYLIGLWYALDAHITSYSYDNVLKNVLCQLQELESEQGVQVKVNGKEITIHAIIVIFSADNLGAHSLFGFMESFRATYFCRFCKCTQTELQETFRSIAFEKRTIADYNRCIVESQPTDYDPSKTGIKHGCSFNCLNWFHCVEQSAVDCMHDLLEGVVPLEICLVLRTLTEKKIISILDINNAINNFNYSLADKNSKPPEINLQNIRIQAAESWCLIRNLPLMIGKYIPDEEPHWKLLILLLRCLDIIFAPAITDGLITQLEFLIEEHHCYFKSVYPESRLIPKHHFMLHYPECMAKFGPLSRYWCMRFEAKHRFAKELSSVICNFKNICYSVMHRYQLKLANCLFSRSLYSDIKQLGKCDKVIIGNLHVEIGSIICESLNLNIFDEVYVSCSITFGSYLIKLGCILCHDVVEGYPQFGELLCIVYIAPKSFLVLNPLETINFNEHFYAYVVQRNKILCKNIVINADSCKDYHPYNITNLCDQMFIGTRYRIF
ncbi:uncharacterized protein LOC124806573 [Hydra vulgaris]|uniref:uncharacterized protein LOC124806573 n=1 Tax=Hydra vulgaris TaxID=6087 RepID=UPI001F5F54D1|nr:uncharacterized protein LOC124806573 [Hydra vulgaris]